VLCGFSSPLPRHAPTESVAEPKASWRWSRESAAAAAAVWGDEAAAAVAEAARYAAAATAGSQRARVPVVAELGGGWGGSGARAACAPRAGLSGILESAQTGLSFSEDVGVATHSDSLELVAREAPVVG
jgi:hypothetical protein